MLSSLLTLLKSLHRTVVEHFAPRSNAAHASTLPAEIRPGDEQRLRGVVEVSCSRDSIENPEAPSVWIRVDTQKLIQQLCEHPDIDLDALQAAASRPPAPKPPKPPTPADAESSQPPDPWHQKVRSITQAPPASRRASRPRPPPSGHH